MAVFPENLGQNILSKDLFTVEVWSIPRSYVVTERLFEIFFAQEGFRRKCANPASGKANLTLDNQSGSRSPKK